jgi:hypothetical protein
MLLCSLYEKAAGKEKIERTEKRPLPEMGATYFFAQKYSLLLY